MNIYLLMASCLTVVLVLAHSILGELKGFRRMKDEGLPIIRGIPRMWEIDGFTKRTLRFVWHLATILGLGFACMLAYFSNLSFLSNTDLFVVKTISVAMLLSGILTLVISKGSHLGWILLIVIGTLCLVVVL